MSVWNHLVAHWQATLVMLAFDACFACGFAIAWMGLSE